MAIADDVTVDAANQIIRVRNTTYSVNAVYSHLQDRFDEPGLMDDLPPMLANTPTEYTMINGWFLDDESTRFLTGGAMSTTGWTAGVVRQIQYDASGGSTPFSSADIGRTITGTTSTDQAVILDYDTSVGADTGWLWLRPIVAALDLAAVGDNFDGGKEAYTIDNENVSHFWQVDDSGPTFVDDTAAANVGAADLNPFVAFGIQEINQDYCAIGFTQTFSQINCNYSGGTAGTVGVVAWEYWDGTAWTALAGVTDNTDSFKTAAADNLTVFWTVPTDWASVVLDTSEDLYWVRARITTLFTNDVVLDTIEIDSSAVGLFDQTAVTASIVVWEDNNTVFTNKSTEFNSATAASYTPFPAATVANEDAAVFGYILPFNQMTFDYAGGTAGTACDGEWQYWNGTAWTALAGVTDNTGTGTNTAFTQGVADGLTVFWTVPTDWATQTLGAGAGSVPSLYYVRFFLDVTAYTIHPVLDQGFVHPVSSTGEALWANGVLIGTLKADSEYYFVQERIDGLDPDGPNKLSNTLRDGSTPWYGQDAIDVLLKVQEVGSLFDNGVVTTFGRQPGRGYSHFTADMSAGGRVSIPLAQGDDFNTIQGFRNTATVAGAGTMVADEILNRAIDATADGGATANTLLDVSQTFLTDGVRAGDVIRNTTDVETGLVLTVTETILTTSGLPTTLSSKAYEIDVTQYKARIQGGTDLVGATKDFDYWVLGDLTDFTNGLIARGLTSSATATMVTPTDANGATYSDVTLTFGSTVQDIDDGAGNRPYDCIVNCNSRPLIEVYERLQFLTRRGSATLVGLVGTYTGRPGEQYLSAVDRSWELSAEAVALTEGLRVEGQTSGATARLITAHSAQAPKFIGLKEVHGTFVTGETVTDTTATGSVTLVTTTTSNAGVYAIVSQAPFGSLAGGKVFGARGVFYSNLNTADVQNFQLIDSEGSVRVPPNTVAVTVNNIAEFDFVSVFVLTGSGGSIDKDQFGGMTLSAVGDAIVTVAGTVPTDNSNTGVIRIIDTSAGVEERYRYLSRTEGAGGVFTLDTVTGTADSGGGATALVDAAGDFVGNGVQVDDQIRNVTDGNTNIARVTDVEAPGGVLTLDTGTPGDTETVVIVGAGGTRTYRFMAAIALEDDVASAGSFANAATNLIRAITGTGTAGVDYHADTVTNVDYTASTGGAGIVDLFSANKGKANDGLAITETCANGAWDNATTSSKALTTDALTGGTSDDWAAADTYEINYITKIYTTSDDLYAAIIDQNIDSADVTAGLVSNTLKFTTNIFTTVRTRQGKTILPFESPGTVTSGGLIVPTIRTTDTIAT